MGIWGAICSVASSVCSAVSSLCSGIGGAVMRGVSALAPTLDTHILVFVAVDSILEFRQCLS